MTGETEDDEEVELTRISVEGVDPSELTEEDREGLVAQVHSWLMEETDAWPVSVSVEKPPEGQEAER